MRGVDSLTCTRRRWRVMPRAAGSSSPAAWLSIHVARSGASWVAAAVAALLWSAPARADTPAGHALLHFDGSRWSVLPAPGSTVSGTARDDVWTAGGIYGMRHWDGTSWTRVVTGDNTAWGITGFARGRPWLYGQNGSILRHR